MNNIKQLNKFFVRFGESILLATQNDHKRKELEAIIGDQFIVKDISSCATIPCIKETGNSFEENALLKATITSNYTNINLILADDSGLQVHAINNEPGIYSSRYAREDATDIENMRLLLHKLQNIPANQRHACFHTCLALLDKKTGQHKFFKGELVGTIAESMRGNHGFGYDPIFIPFGYNQTLGELPLNLKKKISHRSKAIHLFYQWLLTSS